MQISKETLLPKNVLKIKEASNYIIKNNIFVINNNLAQYSVYITNYENEKYKIEAYVFFNFKYLVNHGQIENYLCLVKLLNVKNYHASDESIMLETVETWGYYFLANRRLTFKFKADDFKSVLIYPRNFKIENLVVAVIRKDDYDRNLNVSRFIDEIDEKKIDKIEKLVFPYALIRYQKPDILKMEIGKSVGSCVHFTYALPSYLSNWIDMHLQFGIAEIMFYDGTPNLTLTRLVREQYPKENRITVKPYRITESEMCGDSMLPKTDNQKLNFLLRKYCSNFYNLEFKDFIGGRTHHEQITSNDCLTRLRMKHEYVTYYDLDEFVFPRASNVTLDSLFNCNDKKSLCSMKPFQVSGSETSYFYNYLDSLVDKYSMGRNKAKLGSISFDHAGYLISNNNTNKFFDNLGLIISNISQNTNSVVFPITLYLGDTSSHKFIIEKKDIEHARYLFKAYSSLLTCNLNNTFKHENKNLDVILQRFLYFLTEPEQRWPKCIHYGRNVEAVFLHYATHLAPDSWELKANALDGHMLPHFRKDMNWFDNKINSSISKLNIDFEYLFFIIQNFSGFCF